MWGKRLGRAEVEWFPSEHELLNPSNTPHHTHIKQIAVCVNTPNGANRIIWGGFMLKDIELMGVGHIHGSYTEVRRQIYFCQNLKLTYQFNKSN